MIDSSEQSYLPKVFMRYLILFIFSMVLIGCGTAPSMQETARTEAAKSEDKRKGINALAYGQSMKTVHMHLLQIYHPVADFLMDGNTYSIDVFSTGPTGRNHNTVYLALYENKTLIAVAPEKGIKYPDAYHMTSQYTKLLNKEKINAAGCDRYYADFYSDSYLKGLINEIKNKKVKLGYGTLVLSEERIQDIIAAQSTEKEKRFTGEDAAQMAVMAPVNVFLVPAAVTGAVMSAPLTVPSAMMTNNAAQKRAAATKTVLEQVRDIPLGISAEANDRPELKLLFKKTASEKIECPTTLYTATKSEMNYDVFIFVRNNRTFMRIYPVHMGFWY